MRLKCHVAQNGQKTEPLTFDNQQPVLYHQSCNNDDCYIQLENNNTDDMLVVNDCDNICEHATINTSDEINSVSSDNSEHLLHF